VELIGTFAIQIAKHQGLKVFVTAGSDSTSIKRKKSMVSF
jgi:NADPH:quinone reductase-like Zn-dependent oxidoreductase